ncbi:MAG: EAL domain-containing protein [Nitriliruptorales bacterium]|nr:EAL domain-containing protein [Nitriliruptorales bacterium]
MRRLGALTRANASTPSPDDEVAVDGVDQRLIDVSRRRWGTMLIVGGVGLLVGTPGVLGAELSVIGVIVAVVAVSLVLTQWHGRRRHDRAAVEAVIASLLSGGVAAYLGFATLESIDELTRPELWRLTGAMALALLTALTIIVIVGAHRRRVWTVAAAVAIALLAGTQLATVVLDLDAVVAASAWIVGTVLYVVSLARLTLDDAVPWVGRRQGPVGLDNVMLAAAGVLAGPAAAVLDTVRGTELQLELVIVGSTLFPTLAIVYLIREVHDRAVAELEAHHDPLTGLLTRSLLHDRLEAAIARARRRGGRLAVLFLDMDHFKEINDSFGHEAGDLVLTRVARRLTDELRDEDSVGRFGGDEFLVLLPEIEELEAVESVGRKLLETVRRPIQFGTVDLWPSASIGTAVYPDDGTTAADLIEKSDHSMYQAKRLGRGRVQVYSEDLAVRARLRQWLELELRASLASGSLGLDFQPVVDITDRLVVGFEAQPRWDHPDLGTIPASVLVPLVEEAGLIAPFVDQVLGRTCERVARWREEGLAELPVAFKVSRRQVTSAQILGPVLRSLMRTELPPQLLELELSEETLTSNREGVRRVMMELRNHGLRCVIEDFGLGNASIGYLTHLPLAGIKIHRDLVAEIGENADPSPVINAIAAVAGALHARVAAEGITSAAQYDFLRETGITIMQGDLLCPPIDEDDLESRLLSASFVRGRSSMAALRLRELENPEAREPLDARVLNVLGSLAGTAALDASAVEHVVAQLPAGLNA